MTYRTYWNGVNAWVPSKFNNQQFCWFAHEAIEAVIHADERHRRVDGRENTQRDAVERHMNRAMHDYFRFEAPPAPRGALR